MEGSSGIALEGTVENKQVRILLLNIRSLRANFLSLEVYLAKAGKEYDLIALTESWARESEKFKFVLSDYTLYVQEREELRGGGVALFVKKELTCHVKEVCASTFNGLMFNVSSAGSQTWSGLLVYRFCRPSKLKFLEEIDPLLRDLPSNSVVLGDMNLNLLDRAESNSYLNLMSVNGFLSMVNEPTRIFGNSATCIDHFFVRTSKTTSRFGISDISYSLCDVAFSDHALIDIIFTTEFQPSPKINLEVIKTDWEKVSRSLASIDWSGIVNLPNLDVAFVEFSETLKGIIQRHTKHIRVNRKIKKRAPWASDSLAKLSLSKHEYYQRWKKHPENLYLKAKFFEYKQKVKIRAAKDKSNYMSKQLNLAQSDPRRFWHLIKSTARNSAPKLSNIRVNDSLLAVPGNEIVIANVFNKFFAESVDSIFSKFNNDPTDNYAGCNQNISNSMFFHEITETEVFQTIMSLPNSSAVGIDELSTKFIKENADLLATPLAALFNRSVVSGVFPENFKISIIIPLFKSGDRSSVSNYRPISLLPIFSKIFEKIIHRRLTDFLDSIGFFADSQYGFRKKRSTDLALFEHLKYIVSSLEEKDKVAAIYCDVSKAFDTIDHTILLNKLENCGIRGVLNAWFGSYLSNRKQRVKIFDKLGDCVNVNRGVPQGSALGPLLFIIYINDLLLQNWGGATFCFADDTSLVVRAKDEDSLIAGLNDGLRGLYYWFRKHKLDLNPTKTKLMSYSYHIPLNLQDKIILHTCSSASRLSCNCIPLKQENKVKYLGLWLDSCLMWHEQTLVLQNRMRGLNFMMYHLSKLFSQSHILTIYRTLYESVLKYGLVHWGGAGDSSLKPIRILQKQVIRNMAKIHRFSSSVPWFEKFQIPTLSRLYVLESVCFVNRNLARINRMDPINTQARRVGTKSVLPKWLRHRSRTQSPYSTSKFFNSLPKTFRSIMNFKRFRKSVLDSLLKNTGYR